MAAHIGIIGLGRVGLPVAKAYLEAGYRVFGCDVRPQALADLEARGWDWGLPLRVMNNPLYADNMNAMGANPVPMAWGEVYNGLQLKTIEAPYFETIYIMLT